MQSKAGSGLHGTIVRLALGAAAIGFVLPLLPLYGSGSEFFFSLGYPLRGLIAFLLGGWTNTAVVAVGIVFLLGDRVGVAGGVFLAVAATLAFTITRQLIETAPHFGRWQTDLSFALEIAEGVLLALAAGRTISARTA